METITTDTERVRVAIGHVNDTRSWRADAWQAGSVPGTAFTNYTGTNLASHVMRHDADAWRYVVIDLGEPGGQVQRVAQGYVPDPMMALRQADVAAVAHYNATLTKEGV